MMPNQPGPDDDDEPFLVKFGPRPTQVIPAPWAERILENYMTRYPNAFAKIMGECSLEGYQKPKPNGTH